MKYNYRNNLDPSKNWPRALENRECSIKKSSRANLRTLYSCEIVLDIENPSRLPEIEEKLKKEGIWYDIWETGSRGYHIHIEFSNLNTYPIEDRNLIRKIVIEYFGCDLSKASENTFIAVEGKPHFKTGKKKRYIRSVKGTEKIPQWVIDEFSKRKSAIDKAMEKYLPKNQTNWVKTDLIFQYALNNKICGPCRRGSVPFKNWAIALVQSGLSDNEIRHYVERIIENCPRKKFYEFWYWVEQVKKGRFQNYNFGEMRSWFQEMLEVNNDR